MLKVPPSTAERQPANVQLRSAVLTFRSLSMMAAPPCKRVRYTRDEVVQMMTENNADSDIDSETGGMSSDEELALDEELCGSDSEAR